MPDFSSNSPDTLPLTPHADRAEDLLSRFGVHPEAGLSGAEALRRLKLFGRNELRHKTPANPFLILAGQFNSPVVFLLIGAAVLALVLGEWVEFVAIAVVLIVNALIGFFTEWRAVRSMEALRELTARTVLVRRDGVIAVLPAEQLVPGDIVVLEAGDMIAADMRVIASANLAADESALTGESLPVSKSAEPGPKDAPLAERASMLFKGCALTRGTGEAVVVGTGMRTELGRITQLVDEAAPSRSPLEHQLEILSRNLIWLTLGITVVVAGAGIVSGRDALLMVESAVALAVAAIPEGLPIVATLALARGMLRMARHNALIEQLSAVETLGATTVILTDKTGTLTENRMHVTRVVTAQGEIGFDRENGTFLMEGRTLAPAPEGALAQALRSAVLCNNAQLGTNGGGSVGDPMEIALLEAGRAAGLDRRALLSEMPEVEEYAFSADTMMMATVHRSASGHAIAVKGAPEAVFSHVTSLQTDGRLEPFDSAAMHHWTQTCQLLAEQGLRLLAVAGKAEAEAEAAPYSDLVLYGVIGLQDPPRGDIRAALSQARRAGISVVMVTGDHATTARSISQSVGLAPQEANAIGGSDLKPVLEMSPEEKDAARRARIFSRVTPAQKLSLIALHQEAGEVVAMTGDGVNDAPALKQADIGIAMGLRGTQVAREAADMVLRDDAFSTIVQAIREGRTIFANIRRFTAYLLSCNLSEILIVALAVVAGLPLPLLPLQILFLNLVTDVFPAFALGTIEGGRDMLNRSPRPPSEPLLGRPQWVVIAFYGILIAAVTLFALWLGLNVFGLSGEALTSMSFYTLALSQLWHVVNMRNWRDGLIVNAITTNLCVWGALVLCLIILAVAALVPAFATALSLVMLPLNVWATVLGLSLVPVLVRTIAALISRRRG